MTAYFRDKLPEKWGNCDFTNAIGLLGGKKEQDLVFRKLLLVGGVEPRECLLWRTSRSTNASVRRASVMRNIPTGTCTTPSTCCSVASTNSSAGGSRLSNPRRSGTVATSSCPRSRAFTRTPSDAGVRNSTPTFRIDPPTASASRAGGAPAAVKKDPDLVAALTALVEPATGGDPMTADKFVRTTLRSLSDDLHRLGHPASPPTVAHLLRDQKYNLHVNVKRLTGPPHPDRDQQFRHIQETIAEFRAEGWPILSVDSKKKELIGNFCNAGATWCKSGTEVNAHDFPSDAQCKAVPYGLYDVLANRGHVVVGTSADTPAFATDAIATWWGGSGRGATRVPVRSWCWRTRAGATGAGPACGSTGCKLWRIGTGWW